MMKQNANFGLTLNQRLGASINRFEQHRSAIFQGLRVAVPAVVRAFHPTSTAGHLAGTVDVTVAINEKVQINTNGPDGPVNLHVQSMTPGAAPQNDPTADTPNSQLGEGLILDVPVLLPGAGGWSLTFPISPGDECLLVFNDLEIDSWFLNGDVNHSTISSRRHDLSDAVAIFGLKSVPNSLPNYSTSSAQLRSNDGKVTIDLATGAVTITAPEIDLNAASSVNVTAPATYVNGNLSNAPIGASGSFSTTDGRVVVVQGGIITSIG